jgi:hypothetical protein
VSSKGTGTWAGRTWSSPPPPDTSPNLLLHLPPRVTVLTSVSADGDREACFSTDGRACGEAIPSATTSDSEGRACKHVRPPGSQETNRDRAVLPDQTAGAVPATRQVFTGRCLSIPLVFTGYRP